jgi:hypothetical protein
MEKANYKKIISLYETMKAMPVGAKQLYSARIFDVEQIRKQAVKLKREGLHFRVEHRRIIDTIVTRIK